MRRSRPVTGSLAPAIRLAVRKESSPFMTTSRELHSSSAMPWNEIMPPSVMMNGSIRVREMMNPIIVSRTTAESIPSRIAGPTPSPHWEMPIATTMETSEASMPTERSMPPEIITIVMLTAMMPGTATCWRMLKMFTGLMNVGNREPPVVIS